MQRPNLILINDNPSSNGLGRYAELLYDSINLNDFFLVQFLSLSFGYGTNKKNFPGQVLRNGFDEMLSQKFPFIKNIPDLSHFIRSRFINNFINSKRLVFDSMNISESIIHYTNPGIFPFLINDNTVVTIHDLIFMKWHGLRNSIGDINNKRYIHHYKKLPFILTFTNFVKKQILELGFAGNVEVIFPSISKFFFPIPDSKELIRNKLKLPQDKILILSVSTNRPGKNLKALKEMMRLMDERYKLVRVGVPVGDSITFQHVSDETLNEIYNACDVMVFPSTEEGFGIPVTEAFKVGLPVVASDIEVMQEVCGNAAILTEPTPHKIAQSIGEALSNSDIFRSKGFNRSLLFGVERFKEDMIKFYRRI